MSILTANGTAPKATATETIAKVAAKDVATPIVKDVAPHTNTHTVHNTTMLTSGSPYNPSTHPIASAASVKAVMSAKDKALTVDELPLYANPSNPRSSGELVRVYTKAKADAPKITITHPSPNDVVESKQTMHRNSVSAPMVTYDKVAEEFKKRYNRELDLRAFKQKAGSKALNSKMSELERYVPVVTRAVMGDGYGQAGSGDNVRALSIYFELYSKAVLTAADNVDAYNKQVNALVAYKATVMAPLESELARQRGIEKLFSEKDHDWSTQKAKCEKAAEHAELLDFVAANRPAIEAMTKKLAK